ncbi:MAG: TetR/AcrR family transcriptional regulator [Propionibacteriales bacterium]|nr:TetR/AcrR family transcriptional regulator [Propionibacteriales bacterium]
MTPTVDSAAAVPTRRERQRQATYDEIIDVARRLLGRQETLSVRGVATEMGLTPPALYRYVDGYDELLLIVARAVFLDVVTTLEAARDGMADDDPAAQLVASSVAFRGWALTHREEFGLIFTNPVLSTADQAVKTVTGEQAFARFYGEIYERVFDRYRFAVPTDEDLDPGVAEGLRAACAASELPCDFPGRPLGLTWVFMRAWSRLYGMVTLEVFGHLHPGMVASGAMFAAMIDDNAAEIGLGNDWPRLRRLVEQRLAATPAVAPPEPSGSRAAAAEREKR